MFDKKKILDSAKNYEDKIFISRILDFIEFASSNKGEKYSFFLDIHRQSMAIETLKVMNFNNYLFWGGIEGADRVMLCVYPQDFKILKEQFSINVIEITSREINRLTHRDFLGALMALQINREQIGDILITDEKCYIFVTEDLTAFVIENIKKIGSAGVNLHLADKNSVKAAEQEFSGMTDSISSPRLDVITASLCKSSRTIAVKTVLGGKVYINGKEVLKIDTLVNENDVISLRGYGKFIIEKIYPFGKKGRLKLVAKKYI